MKIISLVENTSRSGNIDSEHGLSLYIETCGKRILFDMGQGELFYENARKLQVDLSLVDIAIISHGHYDHGGGLEKFLEINDIAPIYIRENAFLPYYNGERYIGLDARLEQCGRLVTVSDTHSLCNGLTLLSLEVAPDDTCRLMLRQGERFIPDSFNHEQYLLIEEGGRRVLISGCSHKGVIAIAEHFAPQVLVGGFHFMDMPLDDALIARGERLNRLDCDFYTCHCTGESQYKFLTKYMKRISYLSAGEQIVID